MMSLYLNRRRSLSQQANKAFQPTQSLTRLLS